MQILKRVEILPVMEILHEFIKREFGSCTFRHEIIAESLSRTEITSRIIPDSVMKMHCTYGSFFGISWARRVQFGWDLLRHGGRNARDRGKKYCKIFQARSYVKGQNDIRLLQILENLSALCYLAVSIDV